MENIPVIIAGGRDYLEKKGDYHFLDSVPMTEVVSGGASGADLMGELYASHRGVPVRRFPANWNLHGRAAGPIRNEEMAKYAKAVVLFDGGRGTDNMYKNAVKYGLKIYDRRSR